MVLGEHDLVLRPGEAAEFDTRTPHWFGPATADAVEFLSLFGSQGETVYRRVPRRIRYLSDFRMTDAQWDHVNGVNVRAMFRMCREAIPALKARAREKGRARIVNTASVMAFDTDYGLAAYCASKAGVGGLTRTLALELGKFNITANYVCPGAIYTGMTRTNFDNPEIRAVWEKKAALRRLGQPIDIARGALLLASDEADFITGHELVVDGGLTLRT